MKIRIKNDTPTFQGGIHYHFAPQYKTKCDVCGKVSENQHGDWKRLNELNKAEGWAARTIFGEWEDFCPECAGGVE